MKTIVEIQNLKCEGCENTIRKELNKLPFINNLDINVEENVISYEAIATNETEQVVLKLSKLGYPVSDETNSLGKKAKSFLSCAIGRIQK